MDKIYNHIPQGVCAQCFEIVHDGQTIRRVKITGGCQGNSQAVARLLGDMPIQKAIDRLAGIDCKGKGTSCPDQLSKALIKLRDEKLP